MKLTPEKGGWIGADWGDDWAWVKFAKDRKNRLTRIVELHVTDPTPEKLRRIPFRRIRDAATMRGAGLVQLVLALGFDEQPEPATLSKRPKAGLTLDQRFKLSWKPRQRLDDAFYRDVAAAYKSAVAFGLQPRKAIVEDTGAKDATVAGWVGQARKRDFLPEASPGKVSA